MQELKVLIAGFGSVGRRHFRNLQSLGCSQFSFLRSMRSTLSDREISGFPVYTDIAEALREPPDVVFITNPSALHLEVAIPAAEAGCHLFIEKPLSNRLEGCLRLQEIVLQNNLTAMIGCQFRFHPLMESVRSKLDAYAIGHVISARAEYCEYLPDWHPWEDYRAGYSAREDMGGGVILTLIHPLDYLYRLFGGVRDVHASVRKIDALETLVTDDMAEITLEFESGMIGQVHVDFIRKPASHRLTVWGDRGLAVLDFLEGTLRWDTHDKKSDLERVDAHFERNTMFVQEVEHFLAAVVYSRGTRIPVADGIAVLEIADRARNDALRRKKNE